ncbi:MAG: ABC transporter substrate-binding protein [Firmicutes bacterium]|nr:ABC transporter substrate-binding protein [Bacillota bacterium]
MKRLIASLTAVVMAAACMTGCGGSGNAGSGSAGGSSSGASTAEGGVFKIGGIGPLTGDASSYGISVKNGAQIAVDEINEAGGAAGYQLELLFEDDELDEEKSVNAYNKLMDSGVNAILGSVTSGCSIAVSEVSKDDGILQITPSGSAQACTQYDNAFRICFTDPMQGELMAKYIIEKGIKKTAIIYNVSDEYSKGIADAFTTEYQAAGGTISASESYNTGDIDFKTQLTTIKNSDAEALFLPVYYSDVASISEQAAGVGLALPYFGCDGWDGVIKQLNGDTSKIDGAVFLTPFVASSEDEKVKNFVEKYSEKFGATPDQFAADGYDGVYAMAKALEQTNGDASNEALISAMTSITVDGVTGSMTFDASGEPNKDALVAVIKDGEYTPEEK